MGPDWATEARRAHEARKDKKVAATAMNQPSDVFILPRTATSNAEIKGMMITSIGICSGKLILPFESRHE